VWNYYNRDRRTLYHNDATTSWTYTTGTWRQARATATNQVAFVVGVIEDALDISYSVVCGAYNNVAYISLGYNSTTAPASRASVGGWLTFASLDQRVGQIAVLHDFPALGYSYVAALEKGATNTFYMGGEHYRLSGVILA
jgi:hypothetical protein